MSYTRTITSNGNSISQEGGQSFNQQLDDLQEQIEEGGGGSITDLGTSSGTANALAGASLVDTATTFTAGRLYRIRTNAANSGAATCSINGGTGVAMKKSPSSAALASGDIADATELLLYYDGTNLQVLSGLTVSADEIAAAMAGEDLDLENLGLHGGYGNITATIAEMLFDHSYNLGSYEFRCNSSRVGGFPLTPSDMPYSAAGATFTNDGNWYNLYSLAQGTHNGEIKIACALFGGLVTFTINGTSISLINDGWGGSYADTTAASGKIAFRVSGGYLQINVGTGISSTPRKFLAIFNGTVN